METAPAGIHRQVGLMGVENPVIAMTERRMATHSQGNGGVEKQNWCSPSEGSPSAEQK